MLTCWRLTSAGSQPLAEQQQPCGKLDEHSVCTWIHLIAHPTPTQHLFLNSGLGVPEG